jgi:membrane associated rhomboid family serine protease
MIVDPFWRLYALFCVAFGYAMSVVSAAAMGDGVYWEGVAGCIGGCLLMGFGWWAWRQRA